MCAFVLKQYWLCEHVRLLKQADPTNVPRFMKWRVGDLTEALAKNPLTSLDPSLVTHVFAFEEVVRTGFKYCRPHIYGYIWLYIMHKNSVWRQIYVVIYVAGSRYVWLYTM